MPCGCCWWPAAQRSRPAPRPLTRSISVIVGAPEQVKHQLKGLNLRARVAVCARWRPGEAQTTAAYAKKVLRHLARRYQTLDAEITELEGDIRRLCAKANPALLATEGVGPDTASVLLVAAGDNPGRMTSERSFAALCGASPVQASSGQTRRHRLNRGGNRKANSALWPMRYHPDAHRLCHQRICDQTPGGRKEPKRDHPLPEAAHRPRDLPAPHQPATNPELRPPAQPPPERRYHYHPGRSSPRNPHRPHLRTRARPRPQSPARYPIPEVAPHPRTGPITNLTTVGASPPCDGKYQTLSGALSKLLTVRFGGEERSPAPDVGTGRIRGECMR